MAGISVSGLISNSFDWQSVVDQLIQIDSVPVANLQSEEATNNNKLASLDTLKTDLTDLQTSAAALGAAGLFTSRTAKSSSSNSTWDISAENNAQTGSYTIAVSQLASAAQMQGASSISTGISATDDVSGVTLASVPTAKAITAGTFTVNGSQVTIALTDSLQAVFSKISDATGGQVTGSYSAASDKITLTGTAGAEVVLGAVNDSSNFLAAMRLANNGSDTVSSSTTLGSVAVNAPLTTSRLSGSLGVDGTGAGTFLVNGVPIDYNANTDSLSAVLSRINASTAGVTASYDSANDRVVLTNNTTGDIGVGVTDQTGTLAAALGLTTGATLQHGKNALFTINGGAAQSSFSNVLDANTTGISGLSVTINSATTETVNVQPDTASMKSAIQDFITKYNTVRSYIDSESKISTAANGTVTTATLSDNHEVQNWATDLRSLAFDQVSGLSGTVTRLENLGIDFSSTDATLSITDESKLDSALSNNGADVNAFFNTAATGFAARMGSYLTATLKINSGPLATQVNTLNKQNSDLDTQIQTLQRRLTDQRTQLTNSFLAMQDAQSNAQSQQKLLTDMFNSGTSSSG